MNNLSTTAAWGPDETYVAKFCFYETPFVVTAEFRFSGDDLHYHVKPNVGFAKSEFQLVGVTGDEAQTAVKPAAAETVVAQTAAKQQVSVATASVAAPATRPPHDFAKWEKNIAAFEESDKTNPPPKGAILFAGSSTIVLWKTLAQDYPDHKVINRGFGGSEIVDSTYYADRMIIPYEPKQIFLRAGGNDINAGRLPEEVADDFVEFVNKIHSKLPKTGDLLYGDQSGPVALGPKGQEQGHERHDSGTGGSHASGRIRRRLRHDARQQGTGKTGTVCPRHAAPECRRLRCSPKSYGLTCRPAIDKGELNRRRKLYTEYGEDTAGKQEFDFDVSSHFAVLSVSSVYKKHLYFPNRLARNESGGTALETSLSHPTFFSSPW